mgnify:CR=1 FL=1
MEFVYQSELVPLETVDYERARYPKDSRVIQENADAGRHLCLKRNLASDFTSSLP